MYKRNDMDDVPHDNRYRSFMAEGGPDELMGTTDKEQIVEGFTHAVQRLKSSLKNIGNISEGDMPARIKAGQENEALFKSVAEEINRQLGPIYATEFKKAVNTGRIR